MPARSSTGQALADRARRAEAMGYRRPRHPGPPDRAAVPDPAHGDGRGGHATLRVGTFVLNNDLRHPAVLAQDLASTRRAVRRPARRRRSAPAGTSPSTTRSACRSTRSASASPGWPKPSPCSRAASRQARSRFAGEHYTITDYDGAPKPVQRPHPPFFIGGGGRRTLTLAGREADIVGLAPRILPGSTRRIRAVSPIAAATRRRSAGSARPPATGSTHLEFNIYPSTWPSHRHRRRRGRGARRSSARLRGPDGHRDRRATSCSTRRTSSSAPSTGWSTSSGCCASGSGSARSCSVTSTSWRRSWSA